MMRILKDPFSSWVFTPPLRVAPLAAMPSALSQATLPLVRLVASTTTEEYSIIEVTGASSGSRVRELVYAKLQIPADNRHVYYIYPSEIGSYALGAAFTDRQLFTLCLERGDPNWFA
ncbi:hypothetical protein FA13DRAFT_497140 [Coprinellus micaceus]|uniref:Uncharacterized protein n=1 Tax=Coprinellus micaceus TaxID=71717 RepID=A0A4Y7T9F3_COPMI|nr:hypothetical protein FA13DRAFT_497140 [Coprinellus micaceus]